MVHHDQDAAGAAADGPTAVHDPLLARARSRVGSTLREKWRLDALLGVGGMAAVYAATHRNGSRAAVKILHAELALNQQVRSRFFREGHLANAVSHDGAVRVIDDDVAEDGSLFLVTELLDGETLEERRLRSGGQLPEDEVLSIADQLLDVLAAAHDKGVVHRDLKPENVFLTRAGQVKVLDFGIARLRKLSAVTTATRTGVSMGTPSFMAPEQARGLWDEVDGQSDLWAVGATVFALLTGRAVHDGRTANEQLLSAMTNPAPALASVLPGVGVAVAHVVDRALAFEKVNRWPNAKRMQEAVRHAYHDRNGAPIATAPRLTVPEMVPDRPGSTAAPSPTTDQPFVRTRSLPITLSRGSMVALAVGAAIAAAVAATLGIAGVGRSSATARQPDTFAIATSASRAVSSIPTIALSTPGVGATDLPEVPPVASREIPALPTRPMAPALAPRPAPATAKPVDACTPPFIIEATGKKHWKAQCL